MVEKYDYPFYLQPVGNIDSQILEMIDNILANVFGAEIRVLPSLDTKPHFSLTGDWNAYQLALKVFMQLRPDSDGITRGAIIGVVENGTFYTENFDTMRYNGPMDGYAAQDGNIAIITLSSYYYYLKNGQETSAKYELQNLVLHEIGHNFGATHCDQKCVMLSNASSRTQILVPKPEPLGYCPVCTEKIRQHLHQTPPCGVFLIMVRLI